MEQEGQGRLSFSKVEPLTGGVAARPVKVELSCFWIPHLPKQDNLSL